MAQEFWYPVSATPHDLPAGTEEWANAGGANKNASARPGGGRVGPMTHDDDTSYVSAVGNSTDLLQALNIDWPSPMVTLGSVFTGGWRHRVGGGTFLRQMIFINSAGTTAASNFQNTNDANTSYVTSAQTDVSNAANYRPGGGSWLVSDFANDQTIYTRFFTNSSGADSGLITSVWGEIQFEPPGGGFCFLLGLAGLMSLQLAGPMTDYTQFEKFLQWRHDFHPRHTILEPAEKVQAWDEYKSYRAPRFFYG